jgi:hypothetical protein
LPNPEHDVLSVQVDGVASAAENLKVGNQQKTHNSNLRKFRIIPNAPGNQKQSMLTKIIVSGRIPHQSNHSNTHGSLKNKKSTKEVEPTRPPFGGKYLEMTMATIDINLIYVTLLFYVSSYAVLCKTEHQLPSTVNIC